MVQKLSTFLSTSLRENPVDSAGVQVLIANATILLDSGTSGNYVRTLTPGLGFSFPAAAHSLDGTLDVDSDFIALRTKSQTLTNKTINLTNNTLTGTIGQFNAALSGKNFVTTDGIETLTNKQLNSPTILTASATGGSYTDISTFGLQDVAAVNFDLRIRSNANTGGSNLTANRQLDIDVKNANRDIDLGGDLKIANDFVTSGNNSLTLTTTGATNVTLPTSGVLISADSANGYITQDIDRSALTTVGAGTYGTANKIPKITVNASGFIDSIGVSDLSTATGITYSTGTGELTLIMTGTNQSANITLDPFTTADLSENTNLYFTNTRARSAISVTDNGGPGSLGYVSGTGVITYTGPTGQEVMDVLKTVDSNGSGLNSDTLDGQQGTYYRIDVYNAAGTLLN